MSIGGGETKNGTLRKKRHLRWATSLRTTASRIQHYTTGVFQIDVIALRKMYASICMFILYVLCYYIAMK